MKDFQTKKMLYLNNLNCSISTLNKELANFPLQARAILSCYFCLNNSERMNEEQIAEYLDIPLDTVTETIAASIKILNRKIPSLDDKARLEYKIANFFDMIEELPEVSILDLEALEKEIEEYIPYTAKKKQMKEIKQQVLDSGKTINEDRYDVERKNKLIRAYQENGDREALGELIKMDKLLIYKIASKFYTKSLDEEDLYQEGVIGYMKALERFDISKGYSLTTYATWWIRQNINRQIADLDNVIRTPVHLYEKINKLKRTVAIFHDKYDRDPEIEELARALEMTVDQTKAILEASNNVTSLNTKINEGSKGNEASELQDFIVDNNYRVEEEVEKSVFSEEIGRLLDNSSLTPREKQVIILRFGLEDGRQRTLEEVGALFNVTRERIRQIEAKALRKLRMPAKRMFKDSDSRPVIPYQKREPQQSKSKENQSTPKPQNEVKRGEKVLSTLEYDIVNEVYGITTEALDVKTIAAKRKLSKDKVATICQQALIKKGIYDENYITKDEKDLYQYIKGPILIPDNFLDYIINDKKEFLLFLKRVYGTDDIHNKSILVLTDDKRKTLYKIAKKIRAIALQTLLKANNSQNINELRSTYNKLKSVNNNSNHDKIKDCTNIYDAIQVLTPIFTFDREMIDYILDSLPTGMLRQIKARYGDNFKNSNTIYSCCATTNINCYNCIQEINEDLLELYAEVDDVTDFDRMKTLYRQKKPRRFRDESKKDLYEFMYDVAEQVYIPHELVDFAIEHMALSQKLGILRDYGKDYRSAEEKQMVCKPVKTLNSSLSSVRYKLITVYTKAENRNDIEALKKAYMHYGPSIKKETKRHYKKNINTSVTIYEYIKGDIISDSIPNEFIIFVLENSMPNFLHTICKVYDTENFNEMVEFKNYTSDDLLLMTRNRSILRRELLRITTLAKGNFEIESLKQIYASMHPRVTTLKKYKKTTSKSIYIYDYIRKDKISSDIPDAFIAFVLENSVPGFLELMYKIYGTENFAEMTEWQDVSAKDKNDFSSRCSLVRNEILDICQSANGNYDVENLKRLYLKRHPRKLLKETVNNKFNTNVTIYEYIKEDIISDSIPNEFIIYILKVSRPNFLQLIYKVYGTENFEEMVELKNYTSDDLLLMSKYRNIVRKELIRITKLADDDYSIENLKQIYASLHPRLVSVSKEKYNKKTTSKSTYIYDYIRKDKISSDIPDEFITFVLENSGPSFLKLMYKIYGTENIAEMTEWQDVSAKERNDFSKRCTPIRNEISDICESANGNYETENLKRIYKERHPKKFLTGNTKKSEAFNLYDYCFEYPKEYVKSIADGLNAARKTKLQKYFGEDYENKISLSDFSKKEERSLSLLLLRFKKQLVKYYSDYQEKMNADESIYTLIKRGITKYNVSDDFIDFILDNTDEKIINLFVKAYGTDDYRNQRHLVIIHKTSEKNFASYITNLQKLIESIYEKATGNYELENLKEKYYQVVNANKKQDELEYFNLFDKCPNFPKEYVIYMARSCREPRRTFFIELFGEDYENKISYKDFNLKQRENIAQKIHYFNVYLAKHYEDYQREKMGDNSIYRLIKKDVTEYKIANEFIDYILDICKESLINLLKKIYASEDYRSQTKLGNITPNDKWVIKQYLNQIREDIVSTYRLAGEDITIDSLKTIYNDNFDSRKYLAQNIKYKGKFDLFDKCPNFSKEYVKYKADNCSKARHDNLVKFFGSDYNKKIFYCVFTKKEQKQLINLLYSFKKELSSGYEDYLKIKEKQEKTQQLDPKAIQKLLGVIDDKYKYHEEMIAMVLDSDISENDKTNLGTVVRKISLKLKPIYNQAQDQSNLEEIKKLYDFNYKIVKVINIEHIKDYNHKIENILLHSEVSRQLLQTLEPIKVYATVLSMPDIIGKKIEISTIAKVLGIDDKTAYDYICEGMSVYNVYENQLVDETEEQKRKLEQKN